MFAKTRRQAAKLIFMSKDKRKLPRQIFSPNERVSKRFATPLPIARRAIFGNAARRFQISDLILNLVSQSGILDLKSVILSPQP